MNSSSQKWSINWVDVKKSLRTLLLVGVSAAVLYFANTVAPQIIASIPAQDSIILPVITFIIELLRRWATNYSA